MEGAVAKSKRRSRKDHTDQQRSKHDKIRKGSHKEK